MTSHHDDAHVAGTAPAATPRLRRPVRWWPAIAVCVIALLALAWVWLVRDATGQQRVERTAAVVVLAGLALLAWATFFSRLPWKARLLVLALVVVAGFGASRLVRVRGVTGDLVPVLAWRWEEEAPGLAPVPADPPALPNVEVPAAPAVADPAAASPVAETPTEAAAPAIEAPAAAPAPSPAPSDFPQFLGPDRNATVRGVRLARDWEAHPPREVWRRAVGPGWSGFAVVGGLAVTQEQRGDEEAVVAYDLATGEARWAHADPGRYDNPISGLGPRATPAIANGRVYAMGSEGRLSCLDLATGRRLWTRNVLGDADAINPEWGKSCSPLVVDGKVVVSAGGTDGRSLAAYDAATGQPAWYGGSDRSGYSSPLVATLGGVRQILIFNQGSLAGHDPATGAVLWEHPWPAGQPNVAQPLVLPGDRVLASSGYGIGSKLFQVSREGDGRLAARLLWESPRLKAKFTQVVRHGGKVYGLDDGTMACLDPETGERCWREGRYGHGQVLLVEDLLLVLAEDGGLALVQPDPRGLVELGRVEALDGKTWNPPTLAGRYLLVRNDREAACYELAVEE